MGNLKDYATSLVATAPSPATSGTSLVVTAGEGVRFPAVPFYTTAHPADQVPTLDNAEKVQVTGVSTDTFTIVRAQGDTTAKSIAIGWRISNSIFLADLTTGYTYQDYENTGTYVYVGYEHTDGAWYIYRRTIATNAREYASGTSAYTWANRASETYS
jgi:hypothetical protein